MQPSPETIFINGRVITVDSNDSQCEAVAVCGNKISFTYASFEENIKGPIEVGKLADLVVLYSDIFEVEDEEIKNLRVDLTMVDGQIRYRREDE